MNDPLPNPAHSADGISSRVVTDTEVRQISEAIGLNRAAPGRSSRLFVFDIYCRFLVPALPGDPSKIVAEVRSLEGLGGHVGTKPAEQFKYPPLQGLWHKHYLAGGVGSMAKNIALGFGKKVGKKNRPELHRIIKENYNPTTAHLPPETISKNIANAVTNFYAERSRKQCLTGDWIVYAQHEGQNYYLCLVPHGEDVDVSERIKRDADVFERIKRGCVDEFPFLRSQLNLIE
jgi:hypothetical protein